MAPVSGKELNEFLGSSQAATLRSNDYCSRELCDNLLNSITTNIKICKYTDPTASSLKFDNNCSLILLHVSIRSLHKNFDSLYKFLVTISFSPNIICLTETRLKGEALIISISPFTSLITLIVQLRLVVWQYTFQTSFNSRFVAINMY